LSRSKPTQPHDWQKRAWSMKESEGPISHWAHKPNWGPDQGIVSLFCLRERERERELTKTRGSHTNLFSISTLTERQRFCADFVLSSGGWVVRHMNKNKATNNLYPS
jgi:hypothetical protein